MNQHESTTAATRAAAAPVPDMATAGTEFITAHTPAGAFKGVRGNGVHVFSGIPFGRSTAGAARFKAPRAMPYLAGVFDATRPAAVPPQTANPWTPAPGTMSEDCLHLNVWAPEAPGPHPVFVWICGGSNVSGACGMPLYDGACFAREGIVVININYRVGALGFLELGGVTGPDDRGSANNAVRDQLLALEWVRRNVAAFGGDPAQTTVGGESAGAFNIAALLGVPAAKGLFRRAIVASGGQIIQDAATADAFTKIFLEELGGPDRLYSAPFEQIVDAQTKASGRWPHSSPFRQLVGGDVLPSSPIDAIASSTARDVDLLIGICQDETVLLVPPDVANSPHPTVAPSMLTAEQLGPLLGAYSKAYPQLSQAELTWKVTTAEAFGVPSMRIADAQASAGGRAYRYVLDYSVAGGPFGTHSPHGLDVPLIFEQLDSPFAHVYGYSPADQAMVHRMHGVWSSFIRTGVPDADGPTWPVYDGNTRQVMVLGRSTRVAENIDAIDRAIWAGTL